MADRGPNGWFLPGNSANPGGRPKKNRDVTLKCLAALDTAVDELVKLTTHYDAKVRIEAIKILLERGLGRPASTNHVDVHLEYDIASEHLEAMRCLASRARQYREDQINERIHGGKLLPNIPHETADARKFAYAQKRRKASRRL